MSPSMSNLNPFAKEFVPGNIQFNKINFITENKSASFLTEKEGDRRNTDLTDIPFEVLSYALSFIDDVGDALACSAVNSLLGSAMKKAACRISLSAHHDQDAAQAAATVSSIIKYLPGTVHLDACNMPLDDSLVTSLLDRLQYLEVLDLSGCRKLTPSIIQEFSQVGCTGIASTEPALLDGSLADCSIPTKHLGRPGMFNRKSRLRVLVLMRCFQLNVLALQELLFAVALGRIPLTCIAVSHMDLPRLPRVFEEWLRGMTTCSAESQEQVTCTGEEGRGSKLSSLKVLALHNCMKMSPQVLLDLACACPNLQLLMLGGSVFLSQTQLNPDLNPRADMAVDAVKAILLKMPSSASCSAETIDSATFLVAGVLLLRHLRLLDLTFFPKDVVSLTSECIRVLVTGKQDVSYDTWIAHRSVPFSEIHILDLTLSAHVQVARNVLQMYTKSSPHQVMSPERYASVPCRVDELSTALRAATSCSNFDRWTPLHIAAQYSDQAGLEALLQLGALTDVRTGKGYTPLFLAAEAGFADIVSTLLAAGADPSLGNTAGEVPLYISALRGHLEVVKILVDYAATHGQEWQNPSKYGDGWTPLMAAAVADHHKVAALLLDRAGQSAARFVRAVNRYGQCVMHIAARKGSLAFLRLLIAVGGYAALTTVDGCGETPLDIARKNRNHVALVEFRRLVEGY